MSKLYVVATPIGNLEDITLRAIRVLKEVDLILCEDTRVTRKLLNHYQIKTPAQSYHQHSSKSKVDKLLSLINQNKSTALVTDAGTPGISDPGGKMVEEALASGHKVEVIPGPSALTAAISISGKPLDRFLFLGFLPHKKGRQTLIKKIIESNYPVIFYESVHRIEKLLEELKMKNEDLSASLGTSLRLVVCRELTKKFETVYRGTVTEVQSKLKPEETKGEFVIIIDKQR